MISRSARGRESGGTAHSSSAPMNNACTSSASSALLARRVSRSTALEGRKLAVIIGVQPADAFTLCIFHRIDGEIVGRGRHIGAARAGLAAQKDDAFARARPVGARRGD